MKVLFAGRLPKDFAYPESNEDALAIGSKEMRIAISDGASESFDSRSLASLLVNKFICEPTLDEMWLQALISEYLLQYDVASLSWSKVASFERGSFATLLGVQIRKDTSSIDILSIGDSLCVLLEERQVVESFPYSDFRDFQRRPELICTSNDHNSFMRSSDFITDHRKCWILDGQKKYTLICMSDALGEWALRSHSEGNPQWDALCTFTDLSQLQNLVSTERSSRNMRIDDVTLVIVDPLGRDDDELPDA